MTKKDFEKIAFIIRGLQWDPDFNLGLRRKVAKAFSSELRSTNPRFDSNRFFDACMKDEQQSAR